MKLLYCPICEDIRALTLPGPKGPHWTFCDCKASWGCYTDSDMARIGGEAICVALDNDDFYPALRNPDQNPNFTGWVLTFPNETLDHVGPERPESDDS